MMRHPAVHIALIVLIALVLTLVARGCDGDHESELPDDQAVTEAPLPAPLEPAQPMAPATPPEEQGTKTSGKPNPCLKRTPAPGASSSSSIHEPEAEEAQAVAPGRSSPAPDVVETPHTPEKSVSVMPYAKGTRPCIKGPPPGRDAMASARTPALRTDGPAPPPRGESVTVLPHGGSNPCVKGPAARAAAPTPPSPPAGRTSGGGAPAPSPGHAAPAEVMDHTAAQGGSGSGGDGPRLVSSLDDGPPMTERIMRRGGEPDSPPPSPTARLAASMDDGTPAPADSHERQHEEGMAHDHAMPAATDGGADSGVADHAGHVERMKAGRHDDLSHVRVEPPAYPAPEKYHSGRNLYQTHCQSCHGDRGTGTDHAPPLLHPYYDPNDHGDDYFYNAVATGARQHLWDYGNMPALPHVGREQVTEIISYVRWLQRQANIY